MIQMRATLAVTIDGAGIADEVVELGIPGHGTDVPEDFWKRTLNDFMNQASELLVPAVSDAVEASATTSGDHNETDDIPDKGA